MTLVIAVVPAFNEEASVQSVVVDALAAVDHVIVVDDGSGDRTAELAEAAGAIVVRHETNQGVGRAVATGLREARHRGADVIVQLDGDGQHDAAFVRDLLAQIESGTDLAIGTRFEQGFPMSRVRRSVLALFARLISARVHVKIVDPTSGFRAFSGRAADLLLPVFPIRYLSDTVEVIFLAHERGLVIRAVPVRMRLRETGEASVGPVRGAIYTVRVIAIIASHFGRRRATL